MVKTFVKAIIALFIVTSAYAGTVGGEANGRLYNTAYFDVTLESQNPMLDYIKYSKRGSFDIEQFLSTVTKIREAIKISISGRIQVPDDIKTKEVYIYNGSNYLVPESGRDGKNIYYNNSKKFQNADYFLVDTKTDKFGNRYVDYKISIYTNNPQDFKATWKEAPNNIIFQVAPKKRGFKNKFEKADIYVFDE